MTNLERLAKETNTDEAAVIEAATRAAEYVVKNGVAAEPGELAAVMFKGLDYEERSHAIYVATRSDYFRTLIALRARDIRHAARVVSR